jgi:2-keto-4-pentenoate hydratase/2-oxohepta-3-ene-1,7-dioic acid hydratase in catechol pathway
MRAYDVRVAAVKLARFRHRRSTYWGKVEDGRIRILRDEPFRRISCGLKTVALSEVALLPPASPSKIILVGLNYKDHAKELGLGLPGEPVIFLKPPSSLISHEEAITLPSGAGRIDYEAELAVVIKKKARAISRREAASCILGYTCLNDVTARDLQRHDGQWTRSKSFDTFCPVGPWLETNLDPGHLKIELRKNKVVMQSSDTVKCIFPVMYLVSFISRIMTLNPGDIISTGTPPGVGKMAPYDIIEVTIEGIGTLRNRVLGEAGTGKRRGCWK